MTDLETTAIDRLKVASNMSEKIYKSPLVLTYSGGKDSDVLLHLAEKSGIEFEVLHSLTTADAPETVHHVQKVFRGLEEKGVKCSIDRHKKVDGNGRIYYQTMWNLIPKKLMPPTRVARYCCSELKEQGGRNRFIATGVRWDESVARKKNRGALEVIAYKREKSLILNNDNEDNRRLFESCQMKGARVVNPIIDWKDPDIWDYCESEKIDMNPLYACGYGRVGCIGCPMAGKHRLKEFADFPRYAAMYKLAFDRMIAERRRRGKQDGIIKWRTGDDVFHWWMEDGVLPGQMTFEDMEE